MSFGFTSPEAEKEFYKQQKEFEKNYDGDLTPEENLQKAQDSVNNKRYNELIQSIGKPVAMAAGGYMALELVIATLLIVTWSSVTPNMYIPCQRHAKYASFDTEYQRAH